MKKSTEILENIVVIAILLVIVQTFLEDLLVLAGSSWSVRKVLVFTGFFFDLFFTVEFLVRFYNALVDRKVKYYLIQGRGWIDFAASIPLLLLNSGPAVFTLIMGTAVSFGGAGFLNILKVVKAIRIARILRLLRVLKIFKQIKYTNSKMAQHHVTKITSISVSTFVFILLVFSLLSSLIGLPKMDTEISAKNRLEAENLVYSNNGSLDERLKVYSAINEDLLIVEYKDKTVFSRYENSYYEKMFSPEEWEPLEIDDFKFFFSLKAAVKIQSRENIQFFVLVVVMVLIYMFYYSPHFAINITDPIQIMKKGFKEKDYALEVEIREKYSDHEIFQLAEAYNEKYLPLKARTAHEQEADMDSLDLKMDDVKDLFDGLE